MPATERVPPESHSCAEFARSAFSIEPSPTLPSRRTARPVGRALPRGGVPAKTPVASGIGEREITSAAQPRRCRTAARADAMLRRTTGKPSIRWSGTASATSAITRPGSGRDAPPGVDLGREARALSIERQRSRCNNANRRWGQPRGRRCKDGVKTASPARIEQSPAWRCFAPTCDRRGGKFALPQTNGGPCD